MAAVLLSAPAAARAQAIACATPLYHPDPAAGDQLGCSVAAHGDTIAVGANLDQEGGRRHVGSVTIFTPEGRALLPPLVPGDAGEGAEFGFSIAISGNTLAVGAPGAAGVGAVYVYLRQGERWIEGPRLVALDAKRGARFGQAVALDGDLLVVGAPNHDHAGSLAGAVYVFARPAGGLFDPAVQVRLRADDAKPFDNFGVAVALDGETIVVGAPSAENSPGNDGAGAAYVFVREGAAWVQRRRLTASQPGAQFGSAVAIAGETLVVGARRADLHRTDGRVHDAGLVSVYEGRGAEWRLRQELAPADPRIDQLFGGAVALDGNLLVVGASHDDERGAGAGAVYLFARTRRPNGTFTDWTQKGKRVGATASPGDSFAQSVAVSGATVVAGAFLDDEVKNGTLDAAGSACLVDNGGDGECKREDFSITKDDGRESVRPGDTVTYTITVESRCTRNLEGALVTDFLAQNAKLRDTRWCRVTTGSSCTPTTQGNLRDTVTLPAKAVVTYRASGTVRSGARCELSNQACVAVAGLGQVCDDDKDAISSPPCGDLVLTKVKTGPAGGVAVPGDTITYRLTVLNRGPSTATGVILADRTPPELTSSGPLPPGCTVGAGMVTCALGAIARDDTVEIALSYAIPACYSGTNPIVNTATVTANEPDRRPEDNFASASCPVVASANLEIKKVEKSGAPVCAATEVTYTLTATNHGPQTACGVVVIDFFPTGTHFRSATRFCDEFPDRSECRIAELPPGSTMSFDLVLEIPDAEPPCPGPLVNRATVVSATPDPVSTNNAMMVTTPLCCDHDDLCVAKSGPLGPIGPGDQVEYTVLVQNRGTRAVSGATFRDVLPPKLTGVLWCKGANCTPDQHVEGTIVDCFDLPAGGTATYRIRGTAPLTCTATLDNVAIVALPPGRIDRDPTNDSSMVTTTVAGPPEFSLVCGVSGGHVEGSTVTYTFVLSNCGSFDQMDNPGDEFVDTLPPGLTLVSAAAKIGEADVGTIATFGNTVTWNGAIPAGEMVKITIDAMIDAGTSGMTLCNSATGNFDADGNGTNESMVVSNECCILVVEPAEIPTASHLVLALLALLLAALALRRLGPATSIPKPL